MPDSLGAKGSPEESMLPPTDAMPRPRISSPWIVLAVIIIVIIAGIIHLDSMLQPQKKAGPNNPVTPPGNWTIFMDVKKDTTISDQHITATGDIIVRNGKTLNLVGCNLTMNGTFYVRGTLIIENGTISDMPGTSGYCCNYGGQTLVILTNLTGSKKAALDFTADYDGGPDSGVSLNILAGGTEYDAVWRTSENRTHITEPVSVDLTPFRGSVAELDFVSGQWTGYHRFNLIGPKITADEFHTATEDMILGRQDSDWHRWNQNEFQFPCSISGMNAEIIINNTTVHFSGHPGPGVLHATGSRITLISSSFVQAVQPNGGYTTTVMTTDACEIAANGCLFSGGEGIYANNSTISIRNSVFSDSGTAAYLRNSDFEMARCLIQNCTQGILASASSEAGKRDFSASDTTMVAEYVCIGLNSINASITGCRLNGSAPVIIYPSDSLSRQDCSVENLARITGTRFEVYAQYSNGVAAPAVTFFSAFPIRDIASLVANNSWNATEPVARYMLLDWPGYDDREPTTALYYNNTGLETDYDKSMVITGEGRFDAGWTFLDSSGHNDPFYDFYLGTTWEFNHRLPVEAIYSSENGYNMHALNEGALQFRLENASAISVGSVDDHVLDHCQDVLVISVPLTDICDLKVWISDIGYDKDLDILNISTGIDMFGTPCSDVNYTATLDGREIGDDWWSSTDNGFNISLDAANLTSGEFVIRAIPIDAEDENLSNNEAHIMVDRVNQTTVMDGEKNLSGVWLLGPGVEMSFRNCSFRTTDSDVYFFGAGNNSLSVRNCTFNVSCLELSLDSGELADTDFESAYSYSYDGRDYYSTGIRITGGNWALENITGGCRAEDFPRMRQAALADPAGYFLNDNYPPGRSWSLDLTADTGNLSISNSSFLCGYNSISAESLLSVSNSTFIQWSRITMYAGNISLEGNRFELLTEIEMEGNIHASGNLFRSTLYGFSVYCSAPGSDFSNNTFTSDFDPGSMWFLGDNRSPTGLEFLGDFLPQIRNNTFVHLGTGIMSSGPALSEELAAANTFIEVNITQVLHEKTITFSFDEIALALRMNRAISQLTISWNDTLSDRSVYESWQPYDLSAAKNITVNIADWAVDTNGSVHGLSMIDFTVVAVSPSGAVWTEELPVTIPQDNSWTEDIG